MKNLLRMKATHHDEDVPKSVYGYRPYLLTFSAAWASAMYGYDSAFIGGTLALPSFKDAYGLTNATRAEAASLSSNIVSTFQGGAFFGSMFGFVLGERFGRKPVLLIATCVFCIGAILQLIGKIGLLYAGRALTGLGVGATSMILPIYISECAPPNIRGRLVGFFEVMLQSALVIGFWVNYGVNENVPASSSSQWHIPVALQLAPGAMLLLMVPLFTVESPRWLVSKGRNQDAQKALAWARNLPEDDLYLQHELRRIENGVNDELEIVGGSGSSTYVKIARELFCKGVRNRLIIGTWLMVLQNMTGINAINYYSPTIFRAIGYTGTSTGLLATGVYGIVKMAATIIYVIIIDRVGRRPLLLIGATGSAIAMFYLGIYCNLSNSLNATPKADAGARLAVGMVYVYAIFYGASWNGIPWLYTSEILPTRVRTLGMAFGVCIQWLSQFIVVYSLPYMITDIGYGTFIFFGTCTVIAFLFAYFLVPETKGVAIEDMGLLFGPDVSIIARKARRNWELNREEADAVVMRDLDKATKMEDEDDHVERV